MPRKKNYFNINLLVLSYLLYEFATSLRFFPLGIKLHLAFLLGSVLLLPS